MPPSLTTYVRKYIKVTWSEISMQGYGFDSLYNRTVRWLLYMDIRLSVKLLSQGGNKMNKVYINKSSINDMIIC